MGHSSKIEWTEATWNPVTGCSKISAGCKNCYAERLSLRLQAMGQPNYRNGFKITLHEHLLELPLHWKKPRTIFVNSMSDLFHKDVPADFITEVFSVMRRAHWHRFQVLTKRARRLADVNGRIWWTPNIWMGVTVESKDYLARIKYLRKTNACVKFLSLEPLLSPIPNLDLQDMDWVIVGGESGPGARPMKRVWVTDIRYQCRLARVPFFFKQWGGINKKRAGRILDGREWNEMPLEAAAI